MNMVIKFEITMTNKWLYSLIAVGVFLALGVGVWAYNSGGPPSVMGHSAEELEINISGTLMNLQQAIDQGDIFSDCIMDRGNVHNNDAINWCPDTHKGMVHCSVSDDSAPQNAPTLIESTLPTTCLSDGPCNAAGIRAGLGTNDVYHELVEDPNSGRQGCWAYDSDHAHNSYKIDLVCCKL